MENAETEGQRLVDEFMAKQAARPVKAIYHYATVGSKTRMGGEIVTASTGIKTTSTASPASVTGCVIRTALKPR